LRRVGLTSQSAMRIEVRLQSTRALGADGGLAAIVGTVGVIGVPS
jgi:hypothetical protein